MKYLCLLLTEYKNAEHPDYTKVLFSTKEGFFTDISFEKRVFDHIFPENKDSYGFEEILFYLKLERFSKARRKVWPPDVYIYKTGAGLRVYDGVQSWIYNSDEFDLLSEDWEIVE